MANYNKALKGIIDSLTERGEDILEVEVGEEAQYFAVKSFQKPSTGTVSSSPYLRVDGWEITDILLTGANSGVDHALSQIGKTKDVKKSKTQEFSDNHFWRYYTKW